MTDIALKRLKINNIKKAIAFIALCILLVVLDKVYSLSPSNTLSHKTTVLK
ncbi:MAG: hypothetical protein H0W73_12095 [Bacteroidetes bacterium]|nr:hypothetical protein [Bacteroidota bacterium]